MKGIFEKITEKLPYSPPFLFVEEILSVDENSIKGIYTLKGDEFFYKGHFPGNPVTPGVIIIEIMAQIGLVCFGNYLQLTNSKDMSDDKIPVFSSSKVDFYSPAFPGSKLEVHSTKIYYRFGKLKCDVICTIAGTGKLVARGELSGFLIDKNIMEAPEKP